MTGLPAILMPEKLTLVMPGIDAHGHQNTANHDNILAFYKFAKPLPEGFETLNEAPNNPLLPKGTNAVAYYDKWDRTYRWPSSKELDPTEDYGMLNELSDRFAFSKIRV